MLFVNGIPLVLVEFKGGRSVRAAYDDNLQRLPRHDPAALRAERVRDPLERLGGAGGRDVRAVGAVRGVEADRRRRERAGASSSRRRSAGLVSPARLLDLVESFVAYSEQPGGLVKSVARYHQVLGVNASLEALERIRETGEKRLGVFWHTQGSGKSLSMLWFTQKVLRRLPGGWTFVMVTDRKELDEQLHGTFVDAGAVSREARGARRQRPAHLRELLRGRPPLRVHADPQVPAARRARRRCRCCRSATT